MRVIYVGKACGVCGNVIGLDYRKWMLAVGQVVWLCVR